MDRPSLNSWLMGLASQVSLRSNWLGTKVGCVAAREGRVVSAGYNGTPRGWRNDLSRDEKDCFCHAEENCIVQAARYGTPLSGCEFYMTLSPCMTCARMLVNVGAIAVFYRDLWEEHDPRTSQLFKDLGIMFAKA